MFYFLIFSFSLESYTLKDGGSWVQGQIIGGPKLLL
jgi:hypothetical protein